MLIFESNIKFDKGTYRMKKVKSYIIDQGKKFLVKEDLFNTDNQLIETHHIESDKVVYRKKYEYDSKGNVIKEEDKNEHGSASLHYKYDSNGNLEQRDHFFGTDLYESIIYDKVEKTLIVDTVREGELYERYVKIEENKDEFREEFYDNDKNLLEYHIKSNLDDKKVKHQYFDAQNNLLGFTIEEYNENNFLIASKSYNPKEEIVKSTSFIIENNKIFKQIGFDLESENRDTETQNEYDSKGNLVKQTITDSNNGKIIRQYWSKFNDSNDMIEEYSNTVGSFNAITGVMNVNESFHHVYEIEYNA